MVTVTPWNRPSLPDRRQTARGGNDVRMSARSDVAELSSLRAQIEDLTLRVVQISDGYRNTDDSAVTGELDQAERSLTNARRALERASATLADLDS